MLPNYDKGLGFRVLGFRGLGDCAMRIVLGNRGIRTLQRRAVVLGLNRSETSKLSANRKPVSPDLDPASIQ